MRYLIVLFVNWKTGFSRFSKKLKPTTILSGSGERGRVGSVILALGSAVGAVGERLIPLASLALDDSAVSALCSLVGDSVLAGVALAVALAGVSLAGALAGALADALPGVALPGATF